MRLQQTEPSTLTAHNQHMTLQMQVDVGALPELGWRGGAMRCAAEHAAAAAAAAAADVAAGSSNATASHQQRQQQPAGEDEIVAQSMVCFRGGLVGGGADSPYTVSMCMPSCPDRDQMLRAPAGRLGLPAYEVRVPPCHPAAPVHAADTAAPLLARTVQIGPFGPGNYLLHVWLQLSCVVKGAEPFYAMLTDSLPVRFLAVEG